MGATAHYATAGRDVAAVRPIRDEIRERVVELLQKHGEGGPAVQWISASSDVIPMIGEYERTSGTVINACLAPKMSKYLTELDERLRSRKKPADSKQRDASRAKSRVISPFPATFGERSGNCSLGSVNVVE